MSVFGAVRTLGRRVLAITWTLLTLSGPQRAQKGLYFNDNLLRRFKLVVFFDRNGVDP